MSLFIYFSVLFVCFCNFLSKSNKLLLLFFFTILLLMFINLYSLINHNYQFDASKVSPILSSSFFFYQHSSHFISLSFIYIQDQNIFDSFNSFYLFLYILLFILLLFTLSVCFYSLFVYLHFNLLILHNNHRLFIIFL